MKRMILAVLFLLSAGGAMAQETDFHRKLAVIAKRLDASGFRGRGKVVDGVQMAVFERALSPRGRAIPWSATKGSCETNTEPWVVTGVRIVLEPERAGYAQGTAWLIHRMCSKTVDNGIYREWAFEGYSGLDALVEGTRNFARVIEMAEAIERLVPMPVGSLLQEPPAPPAVK